MYILSVNLNLSFGVFGKSHSLLVFNKFRLEYESLLEVKRSLQDAYDNLEEVMKFEADQLKQELSDSKRENETVKAELGVRYVLLFPFTFFTRAFYFFKAVIISMLFLYQNVWVYWVPDSLLLLHQPQLPTPPRAS